MADAAPAPADRPSLAAALALWLVVPVVELYLAWPLPSRPAPAAFALEFVTFAGCGWAQWRFARGHALGSPLLPALLVALPRVLGLGPSGVMGLLVYLAGVGLLAWGLLRGAQRLRLPVVAVVWLAPVLLCADRVHRVGEGNGADRGVGGGPVLADVLLWPLRSSPPPPPPRDVGPPVVVISIDTLRADDAARMPSLQRLAQRGAYWPRAMSTSSWTMPSLATLQTGLQAPGHGAGCLAGVHCQGIAPGTPRLAAELSERGYATAAFVKNTWLVRETGFADGFQAFEPIEQAPFDLLLDAKPPQLVDLQTTRAEHVVDSALAWLDRTPHDSFYLWVHLLDPHMPYLGAADPQYQVVLGHDLRNQRPWSPAMQAELRDAYRTEVAQMDAQIERLLDALEARGVLDEGIVVLTADHGEEFWDHGDVEHGHSHHGEVVDVPLVVVAPGVAAGARSTLASLVDVAPTIRAAVGLPHDGFDLRQPLPPDRVATAWGAVFRQGWCSARVGRRRLIAADCDPTRALVYDLVADPHEQLGERPDLSDPLLDAIDGLEGPTVRDAEIGTSAALEALGYVDG